MPLVQSPDRGLNGTKPDNQLEAVECGSDTQNIIYRNGEIRSAFGYSTVGDASLPLDSAILDITKYPEIRTNRVHVVIASSGKLYKYDISADAWDDITRVSGDNLSDINNTTSWAVIGHLDEVDGSFQHLTFCDGGKTAIQRWAGASEDNFSDMQGADGYHDPGSGLTTHFAQQIDIFGSHTILINAKEATAAGVLIDNNQRIRWATTGTLEVWSGLTSGFVDLIDTGGTNVRGAILGNRYIIYQNNSVYGLNPVGGTTVFSPEVLLPDLGLLAPHLVTGNNNVHYFVGDDFNVYQYYGGSVRQRIGDNIFDLFRADMNGLYTDRFWIKVGPDGKRLWLFYAPNDREFMTQAFALDIQQGQWMPRSFNHIPEYSGAGGTPTGGGLTAIGLVGSKVVTTGESYADADPLTGDSYADVLVGTEIATAETETVTTWDAAGAVMTGTGSLWDTGINEVTAGDYVQVLSGTNVVAGFYPVLSIASDLSMTLEFGISDGVGTPSGVDYDIFNPGDAYSVVSDDAITGEQLTVGDSNGNTFQFSETDTDDNGTDIPCIHYTPVFDGQLVDKNKRWLQHHLVAKGSGVVIEYSVDDAPWVQIGAQELTSIYNEYEQYINETSKRIQFRYSNVNSDTFRIREFDVALPVVEDNR